LLNAKYYRNNEVIKEDKYTYYTNSPHLVSDGDEDNVQEINTNFISFMNLGGWDNIAPEDFYDELKSNTIIYHYAGDNYWVNPLPSVPSIGYQVYLPYFIRYSGFDKPKSKTVIDYENGVQTTQTENYYYYESTPNHHLLTKTEEIKSNNSKIFNIILYPEDYSNTTGFIGEMKQKYMINKPVESVKYSTNSTGANMNIIGGSINTYKTGPFSGLIDKVFTLKTNLTIPKSSFHLSNRTAANAILPEEGTITSFSLSNIDTKYTSLPDYTFDLYSDKGNMLQYHKEDDISNSFIWGYNNTLPVIKAINLTNTALITLLSSATDNFEVLLTNIGDMTTDVQKNLWKSFNTLLRNNTPALSMIYTYTYKPLVGMTSQTDPNDITIYYEYDAFGRLKLIRDADNNILKTYEYHYKP